MAGQTRRARSARKRQRRMARVEHDLSPEQWAALRAAWGGCAYCGACDVPLQRDCVLPISRGGRYTLDNIAPACASCNASKCNDEVTGWLRRKRLDERAFLVRHIEIGRALARRFSGDPDADPRASVQVTVLDHAVTVLGDAGTVLGDAGTVLGDAGTVLGYAAGPPAT